MTRTVKHETHVKLESGDAIIIHRDDPMELEVCSAGGNRFVPLTPRDLGRLIAALARTKAARGARAKRTVAA